MTYSETVTVTEREIKLDRWLDIIFSVHNVHNQIKMDLKIRVKMEKNIEKMFKNELI